MCQCWCCLLVGSSSCAVASRPSLGATSLSFPRAVVRRQLWRAANVADSSAFPPLNGAWTPAQWHRWHSCSPSPYQDWWCSAHLGAWRCRSACVPGRCLEAVGPCHRRCHGSHRNRVGPAPPGSCLRAPPGTAVSRPWRPERPRSRPTGAEPPLPLCSLRPPPNARLSCLQHKSEDNSKAKFLYSTVSSPRDYPKIYTLLPWQNR